MMFKRIKNIQSYKMLLTRRLLSISSVSVSSSQSGSNTMYLSQTPLVIEREEFPEETKVPIENIWNILPKEFYYLIPITKLDQLDREL